MAAASRQLLLRGRGFLAGRCVATAPTQAPRAFSTTTAAGGSHVPQSHWQSYESVVEEYTRVKKRHLQVSMAAVFVGVSGLVGAFTKPSPSFKSLIREEMSKTEMAGSSSSRPVAHVADSGANGLLEAFTRPSPSFKFLIREGMSKTDTSGSSSSRPVASSAQTE